MQTFLNTLGILILILGFIAIVSPITNGVGFFLFGLAALVFIRAASSKPTARDEIAEIIDEF